MSRGQQIRAVSVVTIDGAQYILEDMPEELRAKWQQRTLERIGKQFGESLSRRPEEAKKALSAYQRGEL